VFQSGDRVKSIVLGVMVLAGVLFAGVAGAQQRAPDPPNPPDRPDQATPSPAPADASTTGRKWPPFGIALGPGVLGIVPTGDSTTSQASVTLVVRFIRSRRRAGLVPAFSLRGQSTALVDASGAGTATFGSVHIRPVMAGAGWSQPIGGRLSTVFAATVGYSWNGVDASDHAGGRPRLVVPSSVASIQNSLASEVSSRLWLDITPRISVMAGVAFLRTRPEIALSDGSTRRWNADQVRLQSGIAFTVLKRR
jgi:hypothetical protein